MENTKNEVLFTLIEESRRLPDGRFYTGYGICARQGKEMRRFADLSGDRQAVLSYMACLARGHASMIHLDELISDAIGVLL